MNSFYRLWFITLIAKLIFTAWLPLSSDESYYWFWSHHLRLSYYDHPPLIAWLLWLGHPLEFLGQAVRWPTVILGHATFIIWYQMVRPYIDEKNIPLWFFFLLFNPLFGLGTMIAVPDTPVIFFWSLSLFFMFQVVENPTFKRSAALGTSLGLGFCSKYHIVLFVPILLVWLLWDKRWTRVRVSSVLTCVAAGLIFCLPVLIWNYQNDFDSFRYQLGHGLGAAEYNVKWAADFLLSNIGLLFPTTVWALIANKPKPKTRWLYYFGLGPLFFFFVSSFKGRPEANWASLSYPSLLTLAFILTSSYRWVKATILIWIVCIVLLVAQVIHPWIPVDPTKLKTSEFTEYDVLIKVAESYTPFYASSFQMASTLSYKMKKPVYKLRGIGRKDFFDYLEESKPTKETFFVAVRRWDTIPEWLLEKYVVSNTYQVSDRFFLWEVKQK